MLESVPGTVLTKLIESEVDFKLSDFFSYFLAKPTIFCIYVASKHAQTQNW